MISSHEYKTKTMKVVAEKLRRTDEMDAAIDRVAFKLAAKAMMVELERNRRVAYYADYTNQVEVRGVVRGCNTQSYYLDPDYWGFCDVIAS